MAHQRDNRGVSFQNRDQNRDQFGRTHDPSPQEPLDNNQKLPEEQRGEISQAVRIRPYRSPWVEDARIRPLSDLTCMLAIYLTLTL